METSVKLDHKVSLKWLLFFAMPTILSSIFSSLYTTVDGIFVARWVNTDALSAINITMPLIYLASALGMMFGSGGNALVAKKLGEGKRREAQEDCFFLGFGSGVDPLLQAIYGSGTDLTAVCRIWHGFSAQFYYRWKGGAGCISFRYGRCIEYGSGLAVYVCFRMGTCRCRHCDQHRLCFAFHCRCDLVQCETRLDFAYRPSEMASGDDRGQLYQWFFRDGQCAGIFGYCHFI